MSYRNAHGELTRELLDLCDRYGEPGRDGKTYIPLSIADLNTRMGKPRGCGTLYRQLRALAPAVAGAPGRRGLLVDVQHLHNTTPPEDPTTLGSVSLGRSGRDGDQPENTGGATHPKQTASPDPGTSGGGARRAALQAAAAAKTAAAAGDYDIARQLIELCEILVQAGGRDPRETRENRELPAGTARDTRGNSSQKEREILSSNSSFYLSNSSNSPARLADGGKPATAKAPVERRTWQQTVNLVAPLVELARTRSMPGLADRERLLRALAAYDDDQVTRAVAHIVLLVRNNIVTKSPIGWLIRVAEEGQLADYAGEAPATAGPPATEDTMTDSTRQQQQDELDVHQDVLAGVDEATLRELDEKIASKNQGRLILRSAVLRDAARRALWQEHCDTLSRTAVS